MLNVRLYRSLLVAIVLASAAVLVPLEASANTNAVGVTSVGSTVTGSTVTLNSSFKNTGKSATYVLDTEVYSANNIRVAQFTDSLWLNSGSSITKAYQWNTVGASTGTYRIAQGFFKANWAQTIDWSNSSGTVTLTSPGPWQLSAAVNSLSSNVNIYSSFRAPVTGNYMLDTEVYDPNNARVAQWTSAQSMNGGASASFAYSWSATTNVKYTVRQGAFTSDWSQMLAWSDSSTTFNVALPVVAPTTTTTTVAPKAEVSAKAPASTSNPGTVGGGNPLSGITFYGSNAGAAAQANIWQSSRSSDAALMSKLASIPSATWMGEWSGDIKTATANVTNAANASGKTAVLVAYDIPNRDCGGYSGGGQTTVAGYNSWINGMAAGINGHKTLVILEPDALGVQNCLNTSELNDRYAMLSNAVHVLRGAGAYVYIDASYWVDANTAAGQLQKANIAEANGFAVNVSNFNSTSSMDTWGASVSAATGGKHFVVDTSRNGNGGDGQWCNPPDQAVGNLPTTSTGFANADAYLWIKTPGESDGTCNGGPSAGTFWTDYALDLAKRAWS